MARSSCVSSYQPMPAAVPQGKSSYGAGAVAISTVRLSWPQAA